MEHKKPDDVPRYWEPTASLFYILRADPNAVQGRIEIIVEDDLTREAADGTITFYVYGKTATATSEPYGETTIKFTKADDSALSGEVQVIVVVPLEIGKPHPTYDGPVVGNNMCLHRGTSAAYPTTNPNKQMRATTYVTLMTIRVWDQFDNMLDPVYEGEAVEEYLDESWQNINRNMSWWGTYRDPVGIITFVPPELDPAVAAEKALLDAWPTAPAAPMWSPGMPPIGTGVTRDSPIKVGGHLLDVGIVGRTVTILPATAMFPTRIRIEWP